MQHSTKASYLSGNFQMLGPIKLFTMWKERPVTTHLNMDLPGVCFCQGKEAPAGSLKLSWGDVDSVAGINITIWVQFGPTLLQLNPELNFFIKYWVMTFEFSISHFSVAWP